jgi:hypothetical protein
MPRIAPRLFWQSLKIHALLPRLLGVCGNLNAAWRELRWLEEEVLVNSRGLFHVYKERLRMQSSEMLRKELLQILVRERAKKLPFAYVVGSSTLV